MFFLNAKHRFYGDKIAFLFLGLHADLIDFYKLNSQTTTCSILNSIVKCCLIFVYRKVKSYNLSDKSVGLITFSNCMTILKESVEM
jgi:hypothetical protein